MTKPLVLSLALLAAGCNAVPHVPAFLKSTPKTNLPKQWAWTTAIPSGIPRSDLVPASVTHEAMVAFAPTIASEQISLVSSRPPADFSITEINGRPISNFKQVYAAVERFRSASHRIPVGIKKKNEPADRVGSLVEMEADKLLALTNTIGQTGVMRVSVDGNPWVLLRRNGIEAAVLARVEPQVGIMQVVLTLDTHWGDELALPNEVTATCNGKPLKCCTVSQTLELLYGNAEPGAPSASESSFAEVSESDDYLIPTNFKRLQSGLDEHFRKVSFAAPLPALATLQGMSYPGSPILGDARALTAFLLQRKLYKVEDRGHTGWIVFAGDALKSGGTVQLDLDLGSGTQSIQFTVPTTR